MSAFDLCFGVVVGNEGGYSDDRLDPGNWTGGAVNSGECRGTNWGISAAAYPSLDIGNLTLGDARAIYRRDYWAPIRGDELPPVVALVVFDSAVNNGVARAIKLLQTAAGAAADGVFGPRTMAAVQAKDPTALAIEFQARRLLFMAELPTWRSFGLGWARRLVGIAFHAAALRTAADILHRPQFEVGPKERLLRALDAADDARAARQPERPRLVGRRCGPVGVVGDVAPAHQERVLLAVSGSVQP